MRSLIPLIPTAAAVCLLVFSGCSTENGQSALYILEELEAAAAVKDPEARLERLKIFTNNHPGHPYRVRGYRKILETLAVDMNDFDAAQKYFDETLERESDYKVRGNLLLTKFDYLWEADREGAVSMAEALLKGKERYFRLFLYIGYYFMYEKRYWGLSEKFFLRASSLAGDRHERSWAHGVLGSLLEKQGRMEEAVVYLEQAGGNVYAAEAMGRILWEGGRKEEALNYYIEYAAAMPGARERINLDSLYSLVYPGSFNLDGRIFEERVVNEGTVPGETFVDIEGRSYNLSKYRGIKLVVNIWSPT